MKNDDRPLALIDRLSRLYTAVVADVLDRLGYRDQCLRHDIRPLTDGVTIAGFAHTVQTIPPPEPNPAEPYKGEIASVDALRDGDVMMVSTCDKSFWGELLSTAARYRGCRGVIVDGYTRDIKAIKAMGFPVFCTGIHPADSLGRLDVSGHGVPIVCGGVQVNPGDLVLGDDDGIVVLPRAVAEQAISLAEEKVSGENLVRQKLAEGMSVAEAFKRYGVL
ncbi:MAG: RraA family protein [Isosphaeraceae bacterium]